MCLILVSLCYCPAAMTAAKKGTSRKKATAKKNAKAGSTKTSRTAAGKVSKGAKKVTKATSTRTSTAKSSGGKTTAGKPQAGKTVGGKPRATRSATGKSNSGGTTTARSQAATTRSASPPPRRASTSSPGAVAPRRSKRSSGTGTGTASKNNASRPAKPANFDAKTLAGIRAKLLEQRSELERQELDLEEESATANQSDVAGDSGMDDDFADAGTATFDRERDLSIRNNIRDLMDQIDRAAARIDAGTYGVCENCGRPIEPARLKALPHASLCLACKRRDERTR